MSRAYASGATCKNGDMTSASFNRPGAFDLSSLKQKADAQRSGSGSAGGFVREVSDIAAFEDILRSSTQYPVLVEFTSPRAQGADQLSKDLTELANAAQGKFLLARVDVDAAADIAQALRVQAVPMVVALIGGQMAPLFQGVQPKEAVSQVIDQVLQQAVANGIVGTVESAGAEPQEGDDAEKPADPRFAEADAALERGDFAAAEAEFDKLLAQNPADAEALAGKAQAGLLQRGSALDGSEVTRADADPSDVDAQLAAADTELMAGNTEAAFTRLVNTVRVTSGDERERVRLRLLELFATQDGADPVVLKFRRKLATALF